MYYKNILEKILEEVPPCDDCSKRVFCKYRDVACTTFKQYVSTGKIKPLDRTPNNQVYFKLYNEDIRL